MGIKNEMTQGLPGASVVKSLPANAGDTGSISGPGRSHQEGKKKKMRLPIYFKGLQMGQW